MTPTTTRRIPGTDIDVFPLCLGGNVFGFTADQTAAFAVLDSYAEAGGNMIDTADSYCHWLGTEGGESETIIGRWMRSRGNRDQIVIATKVGQAPSRANLRADTIQAALDDSLRRLQTDYVDVYYAHQDHGDPLEETLESFDELVRAGKVRHLAASNYAADRLSAALDSSAAGGWCSYVALSPLYNLMDRADYERGLAPVVAARGLGVFPYWGLASGYLTGKYRMGGPAIDSPRAGFVAPYVGERGERVLTAIGQAGTAHGVRPAAIALAWLAAQPGVVAPVASARSTEQLADLLPMAALQLSIEDIATLDLASAPELASAR